MHLSVYMFGLEDFESREVEELLGTLAEVEDVSVSLSRDRVQPGVIYASAEFAHYSIQLAEFIVGGVALGSLNEAGKDVYLMGKQRVQSLLKDWSDERNAESRQERIHFTLTESGEMKVSIWHRPEDRNSNNKPRGKS